MATPPDPSAPPVDPTYPTTSATSSGASSGGDDAIRAQMEASLSFADTSANLDPTGVWTKFLSASGSPATKKDVAMFFKTLMTFFNLILKQSDEAHKRIIQAQKDAIDGNS